MPTLPEISYRDLCHLIQHFAQESFGIGSPQIRGRNRNRIPFSIHPHHAVRSDILQRVLRSLDVSRTEFLVWYQQH